MAVQAIKRSFAMLRALASGPLGVTELSKRVGLPKSTVARLLASLEAENAVVQTEAGGEYRLGLASSRSPRPPRRDATWWRWLARCWWISPRASTRLPGCR